MADIIRLEAHVKEHRARINLLQRFSNMRLFSPDWILRDMNGKNLVFIEVKEKTEKVGIIAHKWKEGGHGFDKYQYDNYMMLYNTMGIKTILQIWDLSDNTIYEQYLNILADAKDFWTFYSKKDGKMIIAWSIKNFNIVGGFQ
jgi:hypothetical protein